MVEALVRRGDTMMQVGDLSAARILYERAAASGSGAAVLAAGRTYDSAVLGAIDTRGLRADPEAAITWYRRALALGDAGAEVALRNVAARQPQ